MVSSDFRYGTVERVAGEIGLHDRLEQFHPENGVNQSIKSSKLVLGMGHAVTDREDHRRQNLDMVWVTPERGGLPLDVVIEVFGGFNVRMHRVDHVCDTRGESAPLRRRAGLRDYRMSLRGTGDVERARDR